jgi:hypothetical protein
MSIPNDLGLGSTWVFWIGILIGLGGFALAYAGYVADQQTSARIASVEKKAQQRISAADEEARRRIAEVEARTAERRLSQAQRSLFDALFRSSNEPVTVSYLTGQGTGDVGSLITDILEVARQSGASIGGNGTVFGVLPPGISFQADPKDRDTMARLTAFAEGVGKRVEVTPTPNGPIGRITVQIGSRTEGFP